MPILESFTKTEKKTAFIAGVIFLAAYWLFAFDGITFSDDVYYLGAGKNFWNGTMEPTSYHFATRWGAYIPSGLVGLLFGFDPQRVSLISLISYLVTMALLFKILPKSANPWILISWFSTQVYFLHFLTKVYPDSLLVFWVTLVPFSAVYRGKRPFLAAFGVVAGLFVGFLTKETIVFLAPLPFLLLFLDWRKGRLNRQFYRNLLSIGFLAGTAYLAYFWIKFGDPLYRFASIQAGHYISEYTYADKSVWMMLKRLTILPIITFVERAYWIWIVFAIPALAKFRKNPSSPGIEFGFAFLSLLVCFWFMSTNFKFYNPLYLNPRHLIILVPILAFLVSLGWGEWQKNEKLRRWMIFLALLGLGISLIQRDWKMAGFQGLFVGLLAWKNVPEKKWLVAIFLLIPALASVYYQRQIKAYPEFIKVLRREAKNPSDQSPILVNNFIHFSRMALFPDDVEAQNLLLPIENLDSIDLPQNFRVLIYDYYLHAYPKEQEDVDKLEEFLLENTRLEKEKRKGLIQVRYLERK